jgi:hypothetical protein
MGCIGSKDTSKDPVKYETEQNLSDHRKKRNFRDSGLDRHIQACVDQKRVLRKVQDPDAQRKHKLKKIVVVNTNQRRSYGEDNNYTNKSGRITPHDICDAKSKLKKVRH